MSRPETIHIRDYLFRETVSCPLKLSFILEDEYDEQREDLFRRKTKRLLREAVARLFGEVRYTSNRTIDAIEETKQWIRSENVTICGSVIVSGDVRARIPILMKEGNRFTILQVHGKLLKGNPESVFSGFPLGKSVNRYLLMAAYRKYLLSRHVTEAEIECKFIFPTKSYRSQKDHLFQKTMGVRDVAEDDLTELSKLFAIVDGTRSVENVIKKIPVDVSHNSFTGLAVPEAIEKIRNVFDAGGTAFVDGIHDECRGCNFRKSVKQGEKGCWDIHFKEADIKNRDRHHFDLIGHHVDTGRGDEVIYQEQITQPAGLNSSDEVISHTSEKISIYHRKAMQLLDAKDEHLPLVFAKSLLKGLDELEYPIHFLDFEAASHPVPLQKNKRPYEPVIFQFSCHTLFRNGKLEHTRWLDEKPESRVHHELISALSGIPDYKKGTIVQYSPFERQTLRKLYSEMSQDRDKNHVEINILENMLKTRTEEAGRRFLDLSIILRDGYYNRFMNSGLGLKQILLSVLKTEAVFGTMQRSTYEIENAKVELLKTDETGAILDPYDQISDHHSQIQDGITAMHAYLCMKAGALSIEQSNLVPDLLKRYCAMDTLALFVIFEHLKNLLQSNDSEGNIVIEN